MAKANRRLPADFDMRLPLLENAVRKIKAGDHSFEAFYDLVLLGSRVYRQGVGLPPEHVEQAIKDGLK